MESITIDYIKEHWEILLNPNAEQFASVIDASPFQSTARIMDALRTEPRPLSVQELCDRTGLHANTIRSVVRALKGKLFESYSQKKHGASLLISLSNKAIESLSSTEKINNQNNAIYKGKYIAVLPDKKNYKLLRQTEDRWIFEDSNSPTFRILSPNPKPWEQEWGIWASKQRQRGDSADLYTRVDFRLYDLASVRDNPGHASLVREVIKGHFAWSVDRPYEFFTSKFGSGNLYLCYSFLPKGT